MDVACHCFTRERKGVVRNHDDVAETPSAPLGSNQEAQNATETVPYLAYMQGLPSALLTDIQTVGSAPHRAHHWMLQDPHLEAYSLERQQQRFNMVSWYYHLNGPNWTRNDHWLSYSVGECEWYNQNSTLEIGGWHPGMPAEPICDENGSLQTYNLSNNNLQTYYPNFNMRLSRVKILDVSHNAIEGIVGAVGSHGVLMQVLDISYNKLNGQMTGGGGMQSLPHRIFRLDGNQIFGMNHLICTIMPHLEELSVRGNSFETELTAGFANCRNMTNFAVADTAFYGSIPSEFGTLSRLKELDLSGNAKIVGTLPSELQLLSTLEQLEISGTSITGTIPSALCDRVRAGRLKIKADCEALQCCD